jgi:hypothetical protein
MANDRDARGDLGVWLGEELRRARLAAGYTSQDQFARWHYSASPGKSMSPRDRSDPAARALPQAVQLSSQHRA